MTTAEKVVELYETDPEIQKEVNDILADGIYSIWEFQALARKHNLDIPWFEVPNIISVAKEHGLMN